MTGIGTIGSVVARWIGANHSMIGDLSQFAQVFLVMLSAAAIVWQIRSQKSDSAREEYFRGLFSFNDRFQRLADMRGELLDRFAQRDLTLSRETVMRYYTQYWLLNLEEWEYFCAGLLAVDSYIAWVGSAYAHLAGERNLSWYDASGAAQVLSSREISEDLLFRSSFHAYTGFVVFCRGLHALKPRDGDILSQADRPRRIADYVRLYMRRERIRPTGSARKYRPRAA